MLEIVIEEEGRESRTVRVSQFPCQIGRGREAGVQLSGWRIARVHAELQRIGRGIKLVDQGTLVGTRVNGERIVEYGPLSEKDEIEVAGYRLRVQGDALRQAGPQPDARLFGDEGAGGREAGSLGHCMAVRACCGHCRGLRVCRLGSGRIRMVLQKRPRDSWPMR